MKSIRKPSFELTLDTLKAPALALGTLLILVGLGSWLINGFDTPTRILLAAGILLIGVFVAIEPEDVWRRLTAPGALYSGNTLVLGAAIVGILALVNVVASNRHQRWDLTASGEFTLSDQTLQVLANLPLPVHANAFFAVREGGSREAQDRLAEYEVRSNGKLTVETIDPVLDPARAQQAGIERDGTTILTMGDRRQVVTGSGEQDFTNALLKLVSGAQKKVYFTTGHNERRLDGFDRDSYSSIKSSLESENYVVEPLLLAGGREVPADAAVVIIAQPRNPFDDDAKQAIKTYLDNGGKLMLLTQPSLPPSQPQVSLGELVSKWGVEIGSAPIIEDNPQFAVPRAPSVTPAIIRYGGHKITEKLGPSVFPTTTYITTPKDPMPNVTITSLMQTSDRSWGETSADQVADGRQLKLDEEVDPKGPLTIGVAIEVRPESTAPSIGSQGDDADKKQTRVVIFGDADFVSADSLQQFQATSNRDLFVNGVNWLAGEEQLISIRPKQRDTRNMFLTGAQQSLVLYSSVLFLPLIVLAMGGFVWWSRR